MGLLGAPALEHGLGKVAGGRVTVSLHDEGVVEPDVIFVRQGAGLDIIDPEGGVDGTVRPTWPWRSSPLPTDPTRATDRDLKAGRCNWPKLAWGVPRLWIVDADELWKCGGRVWTSLRCGGESSSGRWPGTASDEAREPRRASRRGAF
jgi:hypothetical protein